MYLWLIVAVLFPAAALLGHNAQGQLQTKAQLQDRPLSVLL